MNATFLDARAAALRTDIPGFVTRRRLYFGGAIVAIIIASMSYFTVEQYERGVVTTWGKYSYTADPGLGFKVPFVQLVTLYRTDIQSLAPPKGVNTYTADNQEVDIVFTVFYRIPPEKVEFLYQNAQDYYARLFSIANDRLKAELGKVNVAHFAEHRGEIRDKIKGVLRNDAQSLGLDVTDFQLTDVEYTKSFRAAVEAAATAKAGVETQENLKQQAIRQAEKAKIDAEGKANARIAEAQAEAKAIQLQGEAQAAAMRAQAEALARNPVLVEMKKAEKWNGALPQQLLSGITPFMQFTGPGK